ncbi:MAG: hypothetical protein B6I34_04980 [Anaerolineaceae bacterium 4572_32.1]|nr:MAG: hypothetical protein B6I34_04980 [Anaerolineaceae bacterium 4572_32.1]
MMILEAIEQVAVQDGEMLFIGRQALRDRFPGPDRHPHLLAQRRLRRRQNRSVSSCICRARQLEPAGQPAPGVALITACQN